MAIEGWKSDADVIVHVHFHNGHFAHYACKAKNLAFLCLMIEQEKPQGFVMHYTVTHEDISRSPDYFGFSDKYPNWQY